MPAGALLSPSFLTGSDAVRTLSVDMTPDPHPRPFLPTTTENASPTGFHFFWGSARSKRCSAPSAAFQSGVVTTTTCVEDAKGPLSPACSGIASSSNPARAEIKEDITYLPSSRPAHRAIRNILLRPPA